MHRRVVRIQVERFRQLRSSAIILAREKQHRAVMQICSREEWVKLHSSLFLRDRFVESSEIRQAQTIMRVEVREVRIQFHPAAKRAFSCIPIALVINFDRRQRVVSFRQCVVQTQRFAHVFFGAWPDVGPEERIRRRPRVIQTQSSISGRK